jgi:hypothetical protein
MASSVIQGLFIGVILSLILLVIGGLGSYVWYNKESNKAKLSIELESLAVNKNVDNPNSVVGEMEKNNLFDLATNEKFITAVGIVIFLSVIFLVIAGTFLGYLISSDTYALVGNDKCRKSHCDVNGYSCFTDWDTCDRFRRAEDGIVETESGQCVPGRCIPGEDGCFVSIADCSGYDGYMMSVDGCEAVGGDDGYSEECRGSGACYDSRFDCNVKNNLISGYIGRDCIAPYPCTDPNNCFVDYPLSCDPISVGGCPASEVAEDNCNYAWDNIEGYVFNSTKVECTIQACESGLDCFCEKTVIEDGKVVLTGEVDEECRDSNGDGLTYQAERYCLYSNYSLGGYQYLSTENNCSLVEHCKDFDTCFDTEKECRELIEGISGWAIALIVITCFIFIGLIMLVFAYYGVSNSMTDSFSDLSGSFVV